ncbi:MAG TPA: phytanoyl-CoA dioxygenase family protein [Terracidiphilus sp.]|nr:phytanoyl-CoA dioxygenase family protein [Terracidiphilus sp.]
MQTERIANAALGAVEAEAPDNLGRLGIPYLYRYWQRCWLKVKEPTATTRQDTGEWDLENTLLSGLGLNILETGRFLHSANHTGFESFEEWIIETNGGAIEEERLTRLRDALAGTPVGSAAGSLDDVPGLTAGELEFWDEHGYLVVHDAVAAEDRDTAAAAIYEVLDADPGRLETWYGNKFGKTIWVPLLRHPAFVANRKSPRLVKAFAQLWGREDLWPSIDQGGFNPPEREGWTFPGPHVHWDASIARPHCFGVQGILYLTDTPADQGAFSCIPGFHRTLDEWLEELPAGEDPRQAILRHPGLKPIEGRAGDLVLWHQSLPHGSSPNRGTKPRVAQYIALRPTRWAYAAEWK